MSVDHCILHIADCILSLCSFACSSETKDPLRVQPHLKKLFEGIHELEFKENLDITAMHSKEGELVPLVRIINPSDAKGAVEKWLREVEAVMRETVLDQTARSLKAYTQVARAEWTADWPAQVVLSVNQIHWTQGVQRAISKGGKGALKEFLDKSNAELQFIVMKVRGDLTYLQRCSLGALVVIDVHARDVIEHLIANNVTEIANFDWQSQLRYYFEDQQTKVRMINAQIEYGNEYLGASDRLVITALTDRCYRTLMGALQLNLGGAPEGPAGTGKTETTKDLAKACAIQCVVFNCSDGLDFMAMGKFFKGLASSGAWSCFDEFNRIDLEVLSVVAQQIQTIAHAKRAGVESFLFEGTEIMLKPRGESTRSRTKKQRNKSAWPRVHLRLRERI
jgi:dynein heavy chain